MFTISHRQQQGVSGVAQEPTSPGSRPSGNTTGDEPGEFTRMFKTLRETPGDASSPPAEPAVNDPHAIPDSFTQIFQSPRQPAVETPSPSLSQLKAVPASNLVPAEARSISPAEGFTQVFQQIKPPTSPAPEVHVAASEQAGFTQVFSSIQAAARQKEAERLPVAPAPLPPAQVTPVASAKNTPGSTPAFGDKPQEPGAFTQLFQQVSPSAASPPASPAPAQPPVSPASPGAFTQMFSSPARPAEPPTTPAPASRTPASPASPAQDNSSGGFTEFFHAPTSASPLGHGDQPFASPKAPSASDSSFTQVFQALSSQGPANASASNPAFAPPGSASVQGGVSFGRSEPALAPAAPAAPGVSGGGEFTRLMNSLEQPPAPAASPMSAGASPENAPLPVFPAAPQASNASEYTRVMRGPAYGDSASAPGPVVASAPVAPGMVLAPAKAEKAPIVSEGSRKSKMILLLVIFNIVLVLALIVLAVILLRKH